jgi:hypothetical protein
MKTLNWSVLCPAGGPAAVETARKNVAALRAKVDQARSEVDSAKAAVSEAEEADQAQMAQSLRAGKSPVSSTKTIEALRVVAAEAQRRAGALDLAISQSEGELGEAIVKSRSKWIRDVVERGERAREQARQKLAELEQALDDLRAERGVEEWLTDGHGFDRGKPVRTMSVGFAPGSRGASANREPFSATQITAWLREIIDPPARPEPVEHEPLVVPVEAA